MTKVQALPSPGAIARVRQRTYLVEQVIEGNSASDSTLVRLSCVDDDNQGADREDELQQLESNHRYWSKRLDVLEEELKTEPDRVRALYTVQAQRIDPVGLVYLWPVTR